MIICFLGDNIPSCTVSKQNFENLLRDLLLVNQYRVEIWTPSDTRGSSQWQVARQVSGNSELYKNATFLNNFLGITWKSSGSGGSPIREYRNIYLSYCHIIKVWTKEWTKGIYVYTIMTLLVSQRFQFVGVAFADATLRELGVCEFVDNDVYSNFEVCSLPCLY
jgi:DNA mismatch repair protein MSH2